MAKNWIQGAIKHPGSFKKMAHEAGMSTAEAAQKWQHAPGKKGQKARLAMTLMNMNKK